MELLSALVTVFGVLLQTGYFIYALILEGKGQYQKATFYLVGAIFFLLLARMRW